MKTTALFYNSIYIEMICKLIFINFIISIVIMFIKVYILLYIY